MGVIRQYLFLYFRGKKCNLLHTPGRHLSYVCVIEKWIGGISRHTTRFSATKQKQKITNVVYET